MKFHHPTKDEADRVDDTAALHLVALLEQPGGRGFAGAVMTVMMAHLLATLDDETAEGAMKHHTENALVMRKFVRKRLKRMEN